MTNDMGKSLFGGMFPASEVAPTYGLDVNGCGCHTCVAVVKAKQTFIEQLSWPFIVCPTCGNKRCPKATHHDNQCTNSNETGQTGSRFEDLT